jgi:hypothetical protein
VKLRFGLIAMASAAAFGITFATGALPAFANQTDTFYITNAANITMYMVSNNVPNAPLFVNDGGASDSGTDFSNINGKTVSILGSSDPVYEWEEVGTTRCWTYEAGNSGYLETQTCHAGATDQLFWQRTNGQLVNAAASNSGGVLFCVNAVHSPAPGGTDDPINVIACKSKTAPGGFDQYWGARA